MRVVARLMLSRWIGALAASVMAVAHVAAAIANTETATDLFEMTIEELGNLNVISQGRRASELSQSPAAFYVITNEEIRASGVATIAEALRLAPGVEVARNGTSSWTISIRGFNSDLSNKLLVLIDGRSVYSPLYAGVFWDAQDTLLADIDRIEVIAGPAGTIWGANAVNGIINVITRTASETHGVYAEVGAGLQEKGFAGFRYGSAIGDNYDARAYVKRFDRSLSVLADGGDVLDDWQSTQAGFNVRWDAGGRDRLTLRGDVYDGTQHLLTRGDFELGTVPGPDSPGTSLLSGYNVVGRWLHDFTGGGASRLQVFIDHTNRQIPGSFDEMRDTYDLDWQRDFAAIRRHAVTIGTGLRMTTDELNNTAFATFEPAERTDRTVSAFVQDRIRLGDGRMELTVGSKFEHNDYTGFEYQPGVRFAWTIDEQRSFWASVARAVRTPARLNTDLSLLAPITGDPVPFYVGVSGDPDFKSENLLAREAGYRIRIGQGLSLDFAVFDNDYDNLQTQEASAPILETGPPTYLLLPVMLANGMQADTYGGTVAAIYQPFERWRLRMNYTRLEMDLASKPGSVDTNSLNIAGNSPNHQVGLHAIAELPRDVSFYAAARYVSALPNQGLDSRVSVDLNLGWQATDSLEVSLTVRNLNDRRHVEFGDLAIERSAFVSLTWTL